jgi:hypothetical protein
MYELFSYWVLLWAFLFYIGFITANPIWILIVIYVITSITYIYIYTQHAKPYYLLKYIILNNLLKLFFIILIARKYTLKFHINDIYFGIGLFAVYLIVMSILQKKPHEYYYYLIDIFINGLTPQNEQYLINIDKYYDYIFNFLIISL